MLRSTELRYVQRLGTSRVSCDYTYKEIVSVLNSLARFHGLTADTKSVDIWRGIVRKILSPSRTLSFVSSRERRDACVAYWRRALLPGVKRALPVVLAYLEAKIFL